MTPRTTRCQPGDLAEFVPGSPNAGRRVTVGDMDEAFPLVLWNVTPLQPLRSLNFGIFTMEPGVAYDCDLRPIRPPGAENQDAEPVDVSETAHG